MEGRLFTNTPGAASSPNLFVAVTIATKVSDALYFLGIQDGRGVTFLTGVLPIRGLATHLGSTLGCMLTFTGQRQEEHSLVAFTFINHLTNKIHSHSQGVPGMDLAKVHCPG